MTPEWIAAGARMVADALARVEMRAQGVDLSRLIARAEALTGALWPDDASFHADLRGAAALDEERRQDMAPWSRVDLRGALRKGRTILDLPVDRSGSDAFSPHGNDLGADLLADWARVKRQSIDEVAARYCVTEALGWQGVGGLRISW